MNLFNWPVLPTHKHVHTLPVIGSKFLPDGRPDQHVQEGIKQSVCEQNTQRQVVNTVTDMIGYQMKHAENLEKKKINTVAWLYIAGKNTPMFLKLSLCMNNE